MADTADNQRPDVSLELSLPELSRRLHLHLRNLETQFPGCWRDLAGFRDHPPRGVSWPEWCWLPMAASYAVASKQHYDLSEPEVIGGISALAGLATWRLGKGIYRIDPTMRDALLDSPLGDTLPPGVLYRLPEWCVYVRDHQPEFRRHGFFAHLEADSNTGRHELRLLHDVDTLDGSPGLVPAIIYLDRPTLSEGIFDATVNTLMAISGVVGANVTGTTRDEAVAAVEAVLIEAGFDPAGAAASIDFQIQHVTRAVQLLLYLCADDPDVIDIDAPGSFPSPASGGGKKRWTAASAPRQWDVGYRVATKLRAWSQAMENDADGPGRRGPRPHLRAAHWHLYWTGAGRAQPRLRWVLPTAVGSSDDLPAVERHVE